MDPASGEVLEHEQPEEENMIIMIPMIAPIAGVHRLRITSPRSSRPSELSCHR